jgi:hypothetical protein
MGQSDDKAAESLYFDVFGVVAANGDFLEPEDGADLLLPEAFLASVAATAIVAFVKGYFGQLGKQFAERLRSRPFRNGELIEVEPSALIAEVSKAMKATRLDTTQLSRAHVEVEKTLRQIGVADAVNTKITIEVTSSVERHWHV